MPRYSKSAQAKSGSSFPAKSLPKAAPPSPQFIESKQSTPPDNPDRPKKGGESTEFLSPEKLSLDATEPFPPELFRLPIPNAVFGRMADMSDTALRSLLALICLSFRFDPADGEWVRSKDWFSRSDIQSECGLSNQGTRNGLSELEALGWTRVDRSGRDFQYQLGLEVPNQRFTYVPTVLLECASEIDSGTELRVVLAVLRGTWGWTHRETNPQSGSLETVHDRWTQLSNRELANVTGRSETAAAQAARALQGEWIEQVRPGSGPYQYRFLPEAIRDALGDGSGDENSFCGNNANDLAPDRQKSGTPTSNKESSSKDKHSRPQKNECPAATGTGTTETERAVPSSKNRKGKSHRGDQKSAGEQRENAPSSDFSGLPPEKRKLAQKLENVGVWTGRIAELLSRYSTRRIRANFELYRRRAAEQTIYNPGAWVCEAIVKGYALPPTEPGAPHPSREDSSPSLESAPSLDHKQTVSEAEKEKYVARGVSDECFHRCLSPNGEPDGRTYMYFDPRRGGPAQREGVPRRGGSPQQG